MNCLNFYQSGGALGSLFLVKRNKNKCLRCDSDQGRYPRLVFSGAAFKKFEGLNVGILKFFPSSNPNQHSYLT